MHTKGFTVYGLKEYLRKQQCSVGTYMAGYGLCGGGVTQSQVYLYMHSNQEVIAVTVRGESVSQNLSLILALSQEDEPDITFRIIMLAAGQSPDPAACRTALS